MHIDELYELCETISREVADANEKIRSAGGKLSGADVDYIDKLTHILKSVKTTIAMMEAEDGGAYAYARGRGSNAKRDSRGRYASEGGRDGNRFAREGGMYRGGDYAMANDEMIDELHGLMDKAPNEQARQEVKKLISKLEQM